LPALRDAQVLPPFALEARDLIFLFCAASYLCSAAHDVTRSY
jgi:hypothetical protein